MGSDARANALAAKRFWRAALVYRPNLLGRLMAGDCPNFVFTRPGFREATRSGFSKSVGRTMRQPGLVAPIAKPIAEAVGSILTAP
jgi:hypothetical protein